jgi:LuxR family maltose regulon positive regulatory protein
VIERNRITREIMATPPGAMCLLQAPSGYGVTTALAQAMATCDSGVRWVDVSGLTDVGSLRAAMGPWTDHEWLVIDGVHTPSLVWADLAEVAEQIPDHTRVAVGGTVALARLVLGQPWSTLLDRGSLAFTDDEAMALLMTLAPTADPAELELVSQWCEGWAAALVVAASRLRRGSRDAEAWLRVTGPEVLVGRWFDAQPQQVREFLLDTAILDDLRAGACDAVREAGDSGALLAGFEAVEGPVARVMDGSEGEARWRRHRLLTELVRTRTPATTSHQLTHQRAAAWYAERGHGPEAIHHLLEAGEHRQAGVLISDHEGDLISSGEVTTTLDWYSRLSPSAWDVAAEHELRLGWGRLLAGDPFGARDSLARLSRVVVNADGRVGDEAVSLDLTGEVALLRAFVAAAQGDTAVMVAAAEEATEAFAGALSENAAQLAPIALARGLLWQGEAGRASDVAAGIEPLRYPNATIREVALRGVQAAGDVVQGRVAEASAILSAGAAWLADRGHDALGLRQYTFVTAQALALIETGEVSTGLELAAAAALAARRNAATGDLTYALLAKARAEALMAEVPTALETIRGAREDLRSACPASSMLTIVSWAEADALIRAGDHLRAERLVRALPASETRTLLAARVLGPQQPARVARVMTKLRPSCPATEVHRRLQLAECYLATDAGLSAMHLVQGARLADRHGMRMALVDHPRLLDVGRRLAARGAEDAIAGLIASADSVRTVRPHAASMASAPPDLSPGELELLRWLPGRETKAAIADRLGISVNTVKTRLQRLYRKLGVRSRDEAIAEARRRGLLPV